MRDHLLSRGLPAPQFGLESGYFVVTFLGEERVPGKVQIASELRRKLDERQKEIIDFVSEHARITRGECVREFRVSPKTATRDLNSLVELGLLEARGKGPSTHYVLIGS